MTPGAALALAATSWLRRGAQPKLDEERHTYRDDPESRADNFLQQERLRSALTDSTNSAQTNNSEC